MQRQPGILDKAKEAQKQRPLHQKRLMKKVFEKKSTQMILVFLHLQRERFAN